MSSKFMRRFLSLFGISALLIASASAQVTTTGSLSGVVVDPSGATIPGATLTVTEPSTGFTQSVTASATGVYTFPALQPGTYQLQATAKGFANAIYSSVVIEAARPTNVRVQLKVGTTSETVTVSAQGQVLDTSSATLATTLDQEAVQNLPLNGMDALPLAELMPGAISAEGNDRYTTYNGLPAASINISVDGTNDNFQRFRTSTTGFFTGAPLRLGSVDEMTVSTSDLSAEAGAEGSTTVRVITKRGTNAYHGKALWWTTNSYFNANDYLNNALGINKPSSHLNDYVGEIGGPVIKNKLFFFGHFEWQPNPNAFANSTQVLTSAAQAGNFTYMGTDNALHTVNVLNLASSNGFTSTPNSVTGGMLTQINSFLSRGTLSPGTFSTGNFATPVTQTLSWIQPITFRNWWPTARGDWQISPKLSYHGSWDSQWFTITAVPNYPGASIAGGGWWSNYFTMTHGFDWTITPTLLNQARFGILETREEFNPGTSGDPFASQSDEVINPPLSVNPVIPGFILPIPRNNPVYNPVDNLTWTRGNHTFGFGGDIRISTMYETEVNNPPTYSTGVVTQDPAAAMFSPSNFPAVNTGNNNSELNSAAALYAFLTGRISGVGGFDNATSSTAPYKVEGAFINREKQTVGGFYFQDGWHATQHLSLNYGFRWQFSGALTSTDSFWTGPSFADLLGPSTGLFQPGTLGGNMNPQINPTPHPYNGDMKQPSPNFGFAWTPSFTNGLLGRFLGGGNTVLRGGIQISHYDEGWTTVEATNAFTNPGSGQVVFLNPVRNFTPGTLALGGSIPALQGFPATHTFPLPESEFTFAPQAFAAVDPKIRSPYVESWNIGIQRKLPGNNLFQVDYVGNHVVHSWLSFDLNEVNIFGNVGGDSFLKEFQNAQTDLGINGNSTFADNTGAPGIVPLPLFESAFNGNGVTTGSGDSAGFANPFFISLLQQGQAGALAGQMTSFSYFCNLVGANFSPCGNAGGTYPINLFQANPFATNTFLDLLSDPGSSTYNALQAQWRHPVGHGLMFNANYTFSHSLTNRFLGDFFTSDEAQQNFVTLRNPALNKGPAPYDVRHSFKIYATYDLPFGSGRRFSIDNSWTDKIIGGWNVGSILDVHSGFPFKLQGGTNTFNDSFAFWPNASDSGVVLNGVTRGQLQKLVGVYPGPTASNPVVFLPQFIVNNPGIVAPESTPGQLGSFIFLHGPSFRDVDFSLTKTVPIRERLNFKLRAEFINAFNHPNWGVPGVHGTSPADYMNISAFQFNAASEVGSGPRQIQWRAELDF